MTAKLERNFSDKKTEESREVEAVYVDNNGFGFYFDGTPHKLPYTVIGSRLYISRADAWNAWWNAKKRKMPIKPARKQTIKKTEANRNERRTSLSPTQAPLPSVQAIENGLPEPCNQNLHSLDNVETLQPSSAPASPERNMHAYTLRVVRRLQSGSVGE